VINMSLGGPGACNPVYQRAIDDALDHGTTAAVVVAAGNSREDAGGHQPASCARVITVAAGDARGHLAERYSNFGPAVEVMAPGGDVQRDDDGDGVKDGVLASWRLAELRPAKRHVDSVAPRRRHRRLWLAREPNLGRQRSAPGHRTLPARRVSRLRRRCCGAGLITWPTSV
jgi:serine protease